MTAIGAAVIGFLLGLLYCYWNTLKSAYDNRDLITSGGNLVSDAQNFYTQFRAKL